MDFLVGGLRRRGNLFKQSCCFLLFVFMCVVHSRDNPKNGGSLVKGRQDEIKTQSSHSSQNSHMVPQAKTVSKISSRDAMSSFKQDLPECSLQSDKDCSQLDAECLECNLNYKCLYGYNVTVDCKPKPGVVCTGSSQFTREMVCQYCYQTPLWQQVCSSTRICSTGASPKPMYTANCSVVADVICLGNRRFNRRMQCKWENGYRWSTAFILSITLGGFGADRFYLGRWQDGIGKLFSFGGLGVWTIVDIILIGVRYLGPADGSLYID